MPKAFTLLEVVIAMTILGLVFASISTAIQLSLRTQDDARMVSYASHILQDEAERMRLLNWGAVSQLPETQTVPIHNSFNVSEHAQRIQLVRGVEAVSGHPNLRQIQLTASWQDLRGRDLSRTIIFRYAQNGLYDHYYGIHPQ